MKKIFLILTIVALLITSCGKTCRCTYYENGRKIYVKESDEKYYDKIEYNKYCVGQSYREEYSFGTFEYYCK